MGFIDETIKKEENLFEFFNKEMILKNNKILPYRCYHKKFLSLFDYDSKQMRKLIDEGLLIYFPEPKSFTGEGKLILEVYFK